MDLDQEDASELRLGKEFTGVRCLSNAEVAIILEKTKQQYELEDKPVTDAFEKTLAFTKRFSQTQNVVNNASAVEALRQDLQNKEITEVDEDGEIKTVKLEEFEIVALLNLSPEDYDEAIALIPSLQKKISERNIEEILETISTATGRSAFQG